MRPARIWILVADGQKARFLASEKRNEDPAPALPDMIVPNPPTREQGTERPGRVHESVGARRSAYEPPTDPHRQAKRDFARMVADTLLEKTRESAFDKLIVVAPPEMLGDLRGALAPETKARLIGERAKDYTELTPREIKEQLAGDFNV
ncbi:MAG: host attachment protein [Parvibaculum sp.]|uniref:host attachment protein n=1 Tax=Parvibaculum sp. TaxID=2024848 RepID=UPI001E052ADC|nr:host attachment protein [Parvibaculum sp.]MBX3491092.1 host attachment protein [Parvibaculum sp.]MBX3496113.1 host attachment protein [Parvibaculum sp.]MCW5728912.1 host attachment protein [Parvibaculum sp.]